jgi:hypothetical protein
MIQRILKVCLLLSMLLGIGGATCSAQIMQQAVTNSAPGGGGGTATVTKVATKQGSFASPYNSIAITTTVPSGAMAAAACVTDQANSGTTYTVTFGDSKSDTWATDAVNINTTFSSAVIVAHATATSGLTAGTDTFHFTPAVDGHFNCVFYSITTVSTTDQVAGNVSTSSATGTTASITPTANPSVAFAVFAIAGTFSAYGNIMGSAATGLDNITQTSGITIVTEWRALSATTAGTATMTQTGVADTHSVFINFH